MLAPHDPITPVSLGCVQLLAIVNHTPMNIIYKHLFECLFSSTLSIVFKYYEYQLVFLSTYCVCLVEV